MFPSAGRLAFSLIKGKQEVMLLLLPVVGNTFSGVVTRALNQQSFSFPLNDAFPSAFRSKP